MKENIKELAVTFFQWWWNQPGNNTGQGFDEWAKTDDGKKMIAAITEPEPPYLPANDQRRQA